MPRVVKTEVEVSFKFILEPGGNVAAPDQVAFQKTLALFRELQGVPNVQINAPATPSVMECLPSSPTPQAVQAANRTCRHCGEEFERAQSRSVHEGRCAGRRALPPSSRDVVSLVAEYPCGYCGKVLGTKGSRNVHQASCEQHPRHSWPARPAHYTETQCRFCGVDLGSSAGVSIHETLCWKRAEAARAASAPR